MECIQKLIVGALKNSGHTVALVDRELRIRWAAGLERTVIGAPVNALWKGARVAQGQIRGLIRELAEGNGGTAEGRLSGRKQNRMRIDFIPLRESSRATACRNSIRLGLRLRLSRIDFYRRACLARFGVLRRPRTQRSLWEFFPRVLKLLAAAELGPTEL